MPTVCTFDLDKANATYAGGETISGTITIETTSKKQIKDIRITFVGEGRVSWDEFDLCVMIATCDSPVGRITVPLESHEVYIKENTNARSRGVLPAGTHTYRYKVDLPAHCPGSFKSQFGTIDYEICVKIGRYFQNDNVFKKQVVVINTLDLSSNPDYKLPVEAKLNCKLGIWPFSKAKVFCILKAPYSAYLPGQTVTYTLDINNQSAEDTKGYTMEFIKTSSYIGKYIRRKERHVQDILLARHYPNTCLSADSRIIEDRFVIPDTCTPTERNSTIIKVEYMLKVRMKLSSYCSNKELMIPLVIGSLPSRDDEVLLNKELEQTPQYNPQFTGSLESSPPPSYSEQLVQPSNFEVQDFVSK